MNRRLTRALYQSPSASMPFKAGTMLLAVSAALAASSVQAEQWKFEAGASSTVTYTSNSNYESSARRESDVIIEAAPRFSLQGEGRRFRLRSEVELAGVTYLEGTRNDRLLPRANVDANLEAIERFFFIDAGVVTSQLREDPFKARAGSGENFNTVNTTRFQVTPYVQSRLGANTSYELRSANSWVESNGDTSSLSGAYVGRHAFSLSRQPLPLGYTVQASHDETRYESGVPRSIVTQTARLILTAALSEQLQVSARGGYINYKFLRGDNEGELWGAGLTWRPTVRTRFDGFWEDRFFGSGWKASFTHRMPWLAWDFAVDRDISTFPSSLTFGANVSTFDLLNAMLTTRYPDPVERARQVQSIISANGLPATTSVPLNLYAQRVEVVSSMTGSVGFLGARNSLVLSGYARKAQAVREAAFSSVSADTRQDGASLSLSNQISSRSSLNTTFSWARTRGLGSSEGREIEQNSIRVQWTHRLSPLSSGFVGVRYQTIDTTEAGVRTDGDEVGAFVGFSTRF